MENDTVTVGIDIGSLTTKAAVLKNGDVKSCSITLTGDNGMRAAIGAVEDALRAASVEQKHVGRYMYTGAGKGEAPSDCETAPEMLCDVKGALFYHSAARSVIDMGAENTRVIKCHGNGRVLDFNVNDKCAAGTGVFLDTIAKALEIDLEDLGRMSLSAAEEIAISSTCSVFAESEVVGLIARSADRASILAGIHKSLADRVYGQAKRAGIGQPVIFVGGGARNIGIVECMRQRMQLEILVPEKPQSIGAVGAAIIARDRSH